VFLDPIDKVLVYPAYFPSILQMAAMAQSNSIVFELDDNYQKQTYRNRAYIAHSNGTMVLNTPIIKHKTTEAFRKTRDIQTCLNAPWQQHHFKSLESAYRSSPFYDFYIDDLKVLFTNPVDGLQQHNLKIFHILCEVLEWDIEVTTTTKYQKDFDGLDLRNLINAKKKTKHSFTPYIQVFDETNGFLPNLSVLDLLFNLGPSTLSYLRKESIDFREISVKQ